MPESELPQIGEVGTEPLESGAEARLEFLYKAIEDTQNTIRFIDAKAAFAAAIIGYVADKLVNNLHHYLPWNAQPTWRELLFAVSAFFTFIAATLIFKILFPTVNPVEHVHAPKNLTPEFFVTPLHPKSLLALWSGHKTFSKLRRSHRDYMHSLRQPSESLEETLAGELLKTSYIREIKMLRLAGLGCAMLIALILFVALAISEQISEKPTPVFSAPVTPVVQPH